MSRQRFGSVPRPMPVRSAALIFLISLSGGATAQIATEFSAGITGSGLNGIAGGPDGNLWFTETGSNRIARILPTGAVTEFSTGITRFPAQITAGPDGNLWFSESSAIGMATPTGSVTEFTAGITFGSAPTGITAGPDGNLWFAVQNASRIGRITPAGAVTEFTAGITSAATFRITTGPDGNLWFSEGTGIGRITPTGTVTEFTAGLSAGADPIGMTTGSDGNMWFTEPNGNRIGRITPAGVITEFSAGISASAEPFGIAAGSDGNLWFTEFNGNRIGRVTPSGVITEFSTGISAGSGPLAITAGPDGNLWFTEFNFSRIGRITTTSPAPVFQAAASRKVHGAAGTFDLPLSTVVPPAINHNPTTEPRQGPTQTIVFTFDKPVNAATANVSEGTATAAAPTFSGNDVVVGLTGVTDQQYVTIDLTNVGSFDGGTGGIGSVRLGFLVGDVNQNRVVTVADLGLVNSQIAQLVTAANYLKDVNASGAISVADKGITNANITRNLPAP